MATTFTHPIDPLLAAVASPVRPRQIVAVAPNQPAPRVYRRRRLTVATVAVFALITVFFATNALATDPSADVPPAPRTLVAQPGDTIWGIARTLAPTGDITELVEALIMVNGSKIQAGQIVRIP